MVGFTASPSDRPKLDVEKEKAQMESALDDHIGSGMIDLQWVEGDTWHDLRQTLRNGEWHVLHFIVGHGIQINQTDWTLCILCINCTIKDVAHVK